MTLGAFAFLVAAVSCILVAVVVYRARPDRLQNRLLALALFVEGLHLLTIAARVGAIGAATAGGAWTAQFPLLMLSGFAYLAFLGTLETPMTRFLRGSAARWAISGLALAAITIFFVRREWFLPDSIMVEGPAPWLWEWSVVGPGLPLLLLAHATILLFALLVSLHAWWRQPVGSALRSHAAAYAAAFGLRDFVLFVDWIVLLLHLRAGTNALHTSWGAVEILLLPASVLVFCVLIGYAILRHQLFDIDLKLKWGLRRGTLVGIFLALLFVVSESAALFLGERWGPYLGILAAGLLLFALSPVQRFADRLADRAMPHVRDEVEYRIVRKREVYQAALEEILTDGRITAKERRTLIRLQEQLGLDASTAQTIEVDLLDAREAT